MGHGIKKKILLGVIVAVALWPAVHHFLVTRFDVNPWMFFGLSMYTRPRPIVKVVDVRIGMGRRGPLRTVDQGMLGANPARKAEQLEHLTGKLALERLAYGTLGSSEGTLSELFGLFPRARRIQVHLKVGEMDAGARMAARIVEYECVRPPKAGVQCSTSGG